MPIRAITIDFSGTLVREKQDVILQICREIADDSPQNILPADVARRWWERTHAYYLRDYRSVPFVTLREIEQESLRKTAAECDARMDVETLFPLLETSWRAPEAFPDAKLFMNRLPLPVLLLTNGDRQTLEAAIRTSQLTIPNILCSEDASAYKPRKEIFLAALEMLGLPGDEVLHVGDSLVYDISGAQAAGMKTAWLNRSRKPLTGDVTPDVMLTTLTDLRRMMQG